MFINSLSSFQYNNQAAKNRVSYIEWNPIFCCWTVDDPEIPIAAPNQKLSYYIESEKLQLDRIFSGENIFQIKSTNCPLKFLRLPLLMNRWWCYWKEEIVQSVVRTLLALLFSFFSELASILDFIALFISFCMPNHAFVLICIHKYAIFQEFDFIVAMNLQLFHGCICCGI